MSRKHNTRHGRSRSSYGDKVREHGPSHLSDVRLSDGKRASEKRS